MFRKKKYDLEDFSKDLQATIGRVCDFWSKELTSTLTTTYILDDGKKETKTESKNALPNIVQLLIEIKSELKRYNDKCSVE